MAEKRQPGMLEALAALAATAVTTYMMMPPQERMWLRLHVLHGLRQAVSRLARSEGYQGMGDELAGRQNWRYDVAYWLSRARDEIERAIERNKP